MDDLSNKAPGSELAAKVWSGAVTALLPANSDFKQGKDAGRIELAFIGADLVLQEFAKRFPHLATEQTEGPAHSYVTLDGSPSGPRACLEPLQPL